MNIVRDFDRYPFLRTLEKHWLEIRTEGENIAKRFQEHPVVDRYNQGWEYFGLYEWGKRLSNNSKICPVTTQLVQTIPGLNVVAFSRLSPRTHIFPHSHPTKTSKGNHKYITYGAICHLGLIVPRRCYFRIGHEVVGWKEGRSFVFDPTIEHEAWSQSSKDRLILFVDFTHPLNWGEKHSRRTTAG